MQKIMIVDDEPFFIEGLKVLIKWQELGFSICATAQNGEEAITKILETKPDIVLTDIKMPEIEGIEVIRRCVKELGVKAKFVIISGYDDFTYAQNAMKYGVNHYILKPVDEDSLIEALREIQNSSSIGIENDIDSEQFKENLLNRQTAGILSKIEDYVKNNYQSRISLKKISETFYINPVYLGQLFHRKYGMYFNNYLTNIRIEEAKRLLLTTDLKIYEIAEKTGFQDADYFISKFKKLVKDTPMHYRDNAK